MEGAMKKRRGQPPRLLGGKKLPQPRASEPEFEALARLEESLAYDFQRRELLEEALTHRSAADCSARIENERLEFLGDAVLSLAVSTEIFSQTSPEAAMLPEGELSKLRAAIVNEKSLATKARGIGLGCCLRLGRGEDMAGGRNKDSILADAFEALLGAVYLDGGFPAAHTVVKTIFAGELNGSGRPVGQRDWKTELQELIQSRSRQLPVYQVISEEGPPHARIFAVEVAVDGRVVGVGSGGSKKRASMEAARVALSHFEKEHKTPRRSTNESRSVGRDL